jgi:hypothetical protein
VSWCWSGWWGADAFRSLLLRIVPFGTDTRTEFVRGGGTVAGRGRGGSRRRAAGGKSDVDDHGEHHPGQERGGEATPQPSGWVRRTRVSEILLSFGHFFSDPVRLDPLPFLVDGCLIGARVRDPGMFSRPRGGGRGSR